MLVLMSLLSLRLLQCYLIGEVWVQFTVFNVAIRLLLVLYIYQHIRMREAWEWFTMFNVATSIQCYISSAYMHGEGLWLIYHVYCGYHHDHSDYYIYYVHTNTVLIWMMIATILYIINKTRLATWIASNFCYTSLQLR